MSALRPLLLLGLLAASLSAEETAPVMSSIRRSDPRLPESLRREAEAAFDRGCEWLRAGKGNESGWLIGPATNRTETLLPALPLMLHETPDSRLRLAQLRRRTAQNMPPTHSSSNTLEQVAALLLEYTAPELTPERGAAVSAKLDALARSAPSNLLVRALLRDALTYAAPDRLTPTPLVPLTALLSAPTAVRLTAATEALDPAAPVPTTTMQQWQKEWRLPPDTGGWITVYAWTRFVTRARMPAFICPGPDGRWCQPTHELARHVIATQRIDPRNGLGYWRGAGEAQPPQDPVVSTTIALLVLQELL